MNGWGGERDSIRITSYPFARGNPQRVLFDDEPHLLSDLVDIVEVALVLALHRGSTSELHGKFRKFIFTNHSPNSRGRAGQTSPEVLGQA